MAVVLDRLVDDDAAGGHVDAQCQGLGGEHHLDQARSEAVLHRLLEDGDHAGMMRRDAEAQPVGPAAGIQRGQVCGVEAAETGLDHLVDAGRLVVAGVAGPVAGQAGRSLVAPLAAEHEPDGGQQVALVELAEQVDTPRRPPREPVGVAAARRMVRPSGPPPPAAVPSVGNRGSGRAGPVGGIVPTGEAGGRRPGGRSAFPADWACRQPGWAGSPPRRSAGVPRRTGWSAERASGSRPPPRSGRGPG